MDTPIQVDLGRIAQDLQIRRVQVESVVQLLDEGNTVPFITRYRKERTGNLNEVAIREIQLRVGRLRELAERKETILKTIEAQGKLTDELAAAIRAADNPKRLEDLYLPFKPKKKTKASEARDKGLEPLALRIWNRDETLTDLQRRGPRVPQPREGGRDRREGARGGRPHPGRGDQRDGRGPRRGPPRRLEDGQDRHHQGRDPRGAGAGVPRLLQLFRADRAHPAAPRAGDQPRRQGRPAQGQARGLAARPRGGDLRATAAGGPSPRRVLPQRRARRARSPAAAQHGARGPARPDRHGRAARRRRLRPQPPQPPAPAADPQAGRPGDRPRASGPGARSPCSTPTATSSTTASSTRTRPRTAAHEAKLYLKELVGKHKVGVVAIGNGTACRETEELVAEIIAEGTYFHQHPGATSTSPTTRRPPRPAPKRRGRLRGPRARRDAG